MSSHADVGSARTSVWEPTVAVEESSYLHRGAAAITQVAAAARTGRPRLIDLFCGAGGASTGFEEAGFEVLAGIDVHRPSIETFAANHLRSGAVLGDIREVHPDLIHEATAGQAPDVLAAGVPCQGFSRSNRKRHNGDPRNMLFREFLRFVEAFRPPVVLLENVSGLRSAANGAFVAEICKEIRRFGYRVDVEVLNAADFGVPQLRQRVFFVGVHAAGQPFAWPAPSHGPGTGKEHRVVWDAIGDLPPLEAGDEAFAYSTGPANDYQSHLRRGRKWLLNHRAPSHPIEVQRKIAATAPGSPIYPRFKQRIRLAWDRPSPTQLAGGIRAQYQFGHPDQARGLTIRERCRMQSFPDSYEIHGGLVQGRVQTGNAIPSMLAQAIATAIRDRAAALAA